MLVAEGVSKSFGGVRAVDNCSIKVAANKITGLIGPNGAGKTTLFSILSGFLKPDRGEILFKGVVITGLPPYEIFRRGICRTFQISREFRELTVIENLMVVPANQTGETLWTPWLLARRVRAEERGLRRRAADVLALVGLSNLAEEFAGTLSVGQRRLLDLARAIMADAQLLLLDEPGAGVNPVLKLELARYIKWLVDERGVTVLLVEHDMELVMAVCQTVVVMNEGRVLIEGTPKCVREDTRVLEAYLGRARR
jgi:branched-chain amino acid transport system ATP-binding protein